MENLQLIATAPMGLEAVVSRELAELGYTDQTVENGRVIFKGGPADICRANLWLRTSDRVLIKMAEYPATTFEELFEGAKAIDWPAWIPENGEFPVEGRSHKSQLSSVPACQSIVKKAVVEKMKTVYGTEWFAEDGARFVIEVWLLNDVAMITLDTTGPGLHKRGYRKLVTEAPLKETMAAAMVLLSRWQPERPLYDPFCGSGTIPIEAAMIGWNIAPGLRRTFNGEGWPLVPGELWERAREEAFDAVRDDVPLQIAGSDIDPAALDVAAAAVKKAGFANDIKLTQMPVSRIKPDGDYGCIVTNPPYGSRLGDENDAEKAVRQLGLSMLYLPTWSTFALTQSRTFEETIGRKADKRRKLFNGRLECTFYQFFGPLPPRDKS